MTVFDFSNALVIGASSGIGEAIARRLAVEGVNVAIVARREHELLRVTAEINAAAGRELALAVAHDVRATDDVPGLVREIARRLGGLDLVVYAAGVMPAVAGDEYDTDKDREMMEVNAIGAMAWLNPVADRMARLGRGTIVGIGSVAGDRGRSGQSRLLRLEGRVPRLPRGAPQSGGRERRSGRDHQARFCRYGHDARQGWSFLGDFAGSCG